MTTKKWIRMVALVALSIMARAEATTIYSTSAGDGYFHNESGTGSDFFDSAGLGIASYYYFSGSSTSVRQNTGYIQFSLAAFTTESTLGSATLNLYLNAIHYADDSPTAGAINFVSDSSVANGNASQKLGGDVRVVQMKDQAVGWLSLDVTSLVQSNISNGYSYACFSFDYETAGYYDNNGFTINSADAGVNTPSLSVSVIPEPASAMMLMFGAGVGAVIHRIRRNAMRR